MHSQKEYYILTFKTTASVMEAEKYLKSHFSISIMPVPRELTSGCGLSIRFQNPDPDSIINFLKASPLSCTLYRMETKKEDGRHPIEKIYETSGN